MMPLGERERGERERERERVVPSNSVLCVSVLGQVKFFLYFLG